MLMAVAERAAGCRDLGSGAQRSPARKRRGCLEGGRAGGRKGCSSPSRLGTSAHLHFGHRRPAVASPSWQGTRGHSPWGAPSPTKPPGLGRGCCSTVPAHPMVLLGTGRARLSCSLRRCLTVPVIPSPVCKMLTSPPARAVQLERDNYKLLCPHCPCPGSWRLAGGSGHPKASRHGAARTLTQN